MTIDNNEENNKRKNNISTISNSSIDGIIYRPQALIPDESSVEIRAYPTRFWILAVFSFFAFYQTVVWGTFGPIMDSAQAAFGWEDSIIAILQKLGPAQLAITGGAINGIAGCTALALPPLISSLWFPPSERTTATAIGALAAQLGTAGMYLSPLIVRLPDTSNSTSVTSTVVTTVIEVVTKEDIKEDIMKLMYIECGISVGLFLCIIIYFPAEPPKPPSVSSKVERIDYFQKIANI
ncbi:Disrupted in renal carcinoma protein 2-like protein [Armadillidium vulgare]|nr:Disrupted in renal carcinoma protein 2-like protein [Armadillidium vulgare]